MNEQDKRLREIAEKFRTDMLKLGLGVTVKANDDPPVVVTWACPSCKAVFRKLVDPCPNCGHEEVA